MNLDELFGVLISLIPIVLGVIFAKRYNFLHGFITYVVMGFLLVFCLVQFGTSIPEGILTYASAYSASTTLLTGYLVEFLAKIPFLTEPLAGENGKYICLAIFLGVFIICQIFASILAAKRRQNIKKLKRQAKRY